MSLEHAFLIHLLILGLSVVVPVVETSVLGREASAKSKGAIPKTARPTHACNIASSRCIVQTTQKVQVLAHRILRPSSTHICRPLQAKVFPSVFLHGYMDPLRNYYKERKFKKKLEHQSSARLG